MATFGSMSSESAPGGSDWKFEGLNQSTQVWSNFTMPTPGGWVTKLHVYFSTDITAGTCFACMWDSNTIALIASVSLGSVGTGSQSHGGQAWHSAAFGTPVYIVGGRAVSLGFFSPGASGWIISGIGSGVSAENGQGFSAPGALSAPSSTTGNTQIPVFGEYTPNLLKVRRSNAWVEAPMKIRRSGVWVPATPLKIRRGGVWTVVQ